MDVADVIFLNFGDPMVGATEMVKNLNSKIKCSLAVGYFAGGDEERLGRAKLHEAGFPVFPALERAMRGIAATLKYATFCQKPKRGDDEDFELMSKTGIDRMPARSKFITEPEAIEFLERYHIPCPEHALARSANEAVNIAEHLRYPVVMKVVSPDILHKSDVGGVVIGAKSSDEVREAFRKITEHTHQKLSSASIVGILICKQVPEGLEVIIDSVRDPVFGQTIIFGLGGVFTEVMHDVSFRIAPLMRWDAEEMVREIRGYKLLTGVRGQSGYDTDKVIDLLMAVSNLVTEEMNVKELDFNPVRLYEQGTMVLDVRIARNVV